MAEKLNYGAQIELFKKFRNEPIQFMGCGSYAAGVINSTPLQTWGINCGYSMRVNNNYDMLNLVFEIKRPIKNVRVKFHHFNRFVVLVNYNVSAMLYAHGETPLAYNVILNNVVSFNCLASLQVSDSAWIDLGNLTAGKLTFKLDTLVDWTGIESWEFDYDE